MSIIAPVRPPIVAPVASAFAGGLPWDPAGGGPTPVAPPVISGTVTIGGTLTITGTGPFTLLRNGVSAGAVVSGYTFVAADIGPSLTVSNAGGASNALIYAWPSTPVNDWTADSGITITSGKVSAWADTIASTSMAQATAGFRPVVGTLAGGKTSVNFTVADPDFLTGNLAAFPSTTPGCTVAILFETINDPTTTSAATILQIDGTAWIVRFNSTSGQVSANLGTTNFATTGSATPAATGLSLIAWRDASGGGSRQTSILVAGQAQADSVAGASVALASTTPLGALGARSSGAGPTSGKIRRVTIFGTTLTSGQRADLAAWIANQV